MSKTWPYNSLTKAPTNLKEAIDWVLRVTGKDGKELNKDNGECICGLAAAVTDLLQSVELEYHGYEGDVKNGTENSNKGATQKDVTNHLNGLFSLVQGLGGTAVVRTYIDQLAQVLSALVGWSRIEKCTNGGDRSGCKGTSKCTGNNGSGCTYLDDVKPNDCKDCYCKIAVGKGNQLGRGCKRCKDSGDDDTCKCSGTGDCKGPDEECPCALAGKCCKCCCKGKCKDAKCICIEKEKGYKSAYTQSLNVTHVEITVVDKPPTWEHLMSTSISVSYDGTEKEDGLTPSQRRHRCARILLGSVCLIWSGITYMYWTGKYPHANTSPYWNKHILDGSGLDDGTLSQWLQALGFPREMLNDAGPGNRLDAVIWDGFSDKLLLGFAVPSGLIGSVAQDNWDNTARRPAGLNYAGFVHTIHRDSFNTDAATVFPKDGTTSGNTDQDINQHKNGPLFKLYILSCAYFTGLQKRNSESTPRTPRTIREILYWLSALPYSPAYKDMLTHAKDKLEKASPTEKKLSFKQDKRPAPITVDVFNLFAHFQAVTQYCPLVLIGIQGGIHSTKGTDSTKEPPIHSLYANTECHFTYPSVPIQAYNQVVHYIRALFYQLYFLRKQCAVKVTCGGKWRECRYGKDVVSKGVISWMCLGCDPMEHDRKSRVGKVKGVLVELLKKVEGEKKDGGIKGMKEVNDVLEAIGEVVVQLGNAQEALEGKAEKGVIDKVKEALGTAKTKLEEAKKELVKGGMDVLDGKLGELTNGGSSGLLKGVEDKLGEATDKPSPAKDEVAKAIHKVLEVLKELEKALEEDLKEVLEKEQSDMDDITKWFIREKTFYKAVKELISICTSPKCPGCNSHSTKCGKRGEKKTCEKCHQQYDDGKPSPLQAFLEDRLPGFSCKEIPEDDKPDYPSAASHLGHCNGSGQCCPLPMGFRGKFYSGSTTDSTGKRLYGILYFFSNGDMMQSCVYTLVRVTAALSATTPQVLGDVFGFFRGGVGNPVNGKPQEGEDNTQCQHNGNPSGSYDENKTKYFCGWCASGLRDEVQKIEWIPNGNGTPGGQYMDKVGKALRDIKGDKGTGNTVPYSSATTTNTSLSRLTENCQYLSPLTGELYTAVSATFGNTYLSWVLYLSDALEGGLKSLSEAFRNIECRGCKGNCDPNKCKKGHHGASSGGQCGCQSIVSCSGVLPVLYRHGFSYGNPFNLEGFKQENKEKGDYGITESKNGEKHCHEFLESLQAVIQNKQEASQQDQDAKHPLTELLKQVGQLQYDIRLPWIFVLTLAWLAAALYLAFGAIWPLDWTYMRSHWLRGGAHQWQCMWYKVMTGRKGVDLMEYFGRR